MSPETVLLAVRALSALVLYGFLVLVIITLRRDMRLKDTATDSVPQAHLVFTAGERAGETIPLERNTEIGRAAGNMALIDDPTVSAHHARLSYHAGQWWIEDLASRNGTTVNDLPVSEPLVVTYGDALHFGRVELRLENGPANAGESPATLEAA
ncbi:MAG TPA: FHA domain-containing protein [Anaerolineales bacterium]